MSIRHTISVEDDGIGVSLVESVIVSQGSFNQRTDLVHNFDLLALSLFDQGHVLGDLVVHGSNETDCGHFTSFMMHVSTNDHHVFG